MSVQVARTTDIAACQAIRRTVFIEEQGVSEADEVDGRDATALHLLATDGGTPVGTARLIVAGDVGKIGRVAVLPGHRGTGLGVRLIALALEVLRADPRLRVARLGAQTHAIGFYQRLGFAVVGDEYLDAGIAHRDMERGLDKVGDVFRMTQIGPRDS